MDNPIDVPIPAGEEVSDVMRKLLICDDHPLMRTAVTHVARDISKHITIIEAGNADEALAALESHPDIELMLLDLHLPGKSGLELLGDLKHKFPKTPVVVLSADETRAAVLAALENGATGYICKSSSEALLAKFLEQALDGKIALPPVFLEPAAAPIHRPSPAPQLKAESNFGFTSRETDVLGCLLRGMSTKVICRELEMAEGTVKSHTVNIFRKLNVNSRAQVVIEANKRGIPIGDKPG